MDTGQIILYVFIALIVYFVVRKIIIHSSVKHYSPADAAQLAKNKNKVLLLDVRSDAERHVEKINGSVHIPLTELSMKKDDLQKYKDKEIICYCRSGNRSVNAAAKLNKSGLNAANLKGGMIAWNSAGLR